MDSRGNPPNPIWWSVSSYFPLKLLFHGPQFQTKPRLAGKSEATQLPARRQTWLGECSSKPWFRRVYPPVGWPPMNRLDATDPMDWVYNAYIYIEQTKNPMVSFPRYALAHLLNKLGYQYPPESPKVHSNRMSPIDRIIPWFCCFCCWYPWLPTNCLNGDDSGGSSSLDTG